MKYLIIHTFIPTNEKKSEAVIRWVVISGKLTRYFCHTEKLIKIKLLGLFFLFNFVLVYYHATLALNDT